MKKTNLLPALLLALPVLTLASPNGGPLGDFEAHGDVGSPKIAGYATWNAASQVYTLSAGGVNIWAKRDEFHYAYRKMKGDFIIQAQVEFQGKGVDPHRKAGIMARASIADFDSAYVDGAFHGDGLTSLQFRGAPNEQTYQVVAAEDGPSRLRIVKKGSRFTMYYGKPGEELKTAGPIEFVTLHDPYYVGLGVCSHVATTLETAVFSNVKMEETSPTK